MQNSEVNPTDAPPLRLKAMFVLDESPLELIYGPEQRRELERLADFSEAPRTRNALKADPSPLAEVEVIFSGWGAPVMDEAFLAAAPKLKAVFYGAGSVRYFVTEAFWQRGIRLTSAYAANGEPVAEYTLGAILLSLKNFWRFAQATRRGEGWGGSDRNAVPGAFRTTVGMISCGMVARRTLELLRHFDLHRLVYCPFLKEAEAKDLGVELCGLSDIFRRSDVVSLHTPDLPETRGLIEAEHFRQMKRNATFINSARGAVVRENEMLDVLEERPDLTAILDVTHPEPPEPGSRLLTLPNVVLTPHIAGSLGMECRRLGSYMVEEFRRYLAGEPLKWEITREVARKLA